MMNDHLQGVQRDGLILVATDLIEVINSKQPEGVNGLRQKYLKTLT